MNSEPTQGDGMIEALTWLEVNKKRLAVAVVALLVAGFAFYVWSHMNQQKEVAASSALLQLRPTGNSPTNLIPVPSAEYLKVSQAHGGTTAGERARLLAAGALFTEGKFSDAHAQFDGFIRDYPASPWAGEAAFGIAASLEAQGGKNDEALTAYQRVVTSYGSDAVANQSRMAIARIHEAKNQPELALKVYEDISKQSGGMGMSMIGQEAIMRRQELLKKHPNLVPPPTNAPAMAPMVMTNSFIATNVAPKAAPTNTTPATNATPSQKK